MDEHIAELMDNINAVLARIPPEHQGILFQRLFEGFHPQENTRRIELALAAEWAERNSEIGGNLLVHLLHPHAASGKEPDPREADTPQSKRELMVAQLVAATIVQWLGTSIGMGFLQTAFRNAGGKLSYELPDTSGYEPPRR